MTRSRESEPEAGRGWGLPAAGRQRCAVRVPPEGLAEPPCLCGGTFHLACGL